MSQPVPETAEVIVIGGGLIGLSTAYHLVELGCTDVLVLERNTLTSGTSWHAAGVIGSLRATYELTQLAKYASELLGDLEARTGQSPGYLRTGGLFLAARPERLVEYERMKAIADISGLTADLIGPADIQVLVPGLNVDDLTGAIWVEEDGQADASSLCMSFAAGARQGGARIREHCAAQQVVVDNGRVVGVDVVTEDGPATISCRAVVNAAGAWSRGLAAENDIALPVQAVEHMYIVTEPIGGLPEPHPVMRDNEGHVYFKADGQQLLMGAFEWDAKPWDAFGANGDTPFLNFGDDWEQFGPYMEYAIRRYPALENAGIRLFMNGPESFTHDSVQVMGEVPDVQGYFVAAGFNSIGLMSSPGVGRYMAEWIVDGHAPLDLFGLDVARVDPLQATGGFLEQRMREAVGDQFAMHWPFKQPTAGRNLRQTPLHDGWKGATFGTSAAWERPLYFGPAVEPSNTAPNWWPHVRAEVEAMTNGTALVELSPFSKFDVAGEDALRFVQHLCCSNLDVEVGRAVYTHLTNERGGIEADVTVTRLAEDRFRIMGGSAARWHDGGWIRRQLRAVEMDVTVDDVTEDHAVLGVMGPTSAGVLAAHTNGVDLLAMPFATSTELEIAGRPARATRVSYVGERGWELTLAPADAAHVHAALAPDASALGLYGIDSCRMEKGYRHWGHDIGPGDTVLEAGLGFTIDWNKEFLGAEALRAQRASGPQRRLRQFAVAAGHPLLLHDEPVYCDDSVVGRVTSAARGFRVDQTLCFAYVPAGLDGTFEVQVGLNRFELTPLTRPPFDPENTRMRGNE